MKKEREAHRMEKKASRRDFSQNKDRQATIIRRDEIVTAEKWKNL